ncbi:hypothetical protein LCGC14_0282710 [marine sediment metagenome]|uniref:Uncharacterized protein n=1 Tax=marine sediment metagenome TaxID=412755 RepID=A0A0F9UCI8_9ZZZZ
MNIEIFTSVLAALLVYRLLSPIVDRLCGLLGNGTSANMPHSGSAKANSIGVPKDRVAN